MATAADLFYSTDPNKETLHSRIVPTEEQTEHLQEKWNDLASWLVQDLQDRGGFPVKTWLQGSYKMATVIRPIGPHEEYDVDLGAYLCWSEKEIAAPAPEQIKDWLQDSLEAYARQEDSVREVDRPAKERCSRIRYDKQFHIDVPVYHLDEANDSRRLATATKGWEDSDPKKIVAWFQDKVGNPERAQLRRIVRYLKAWAALKFHDDSEAKPSSIMLTVLATEAYIDTTNTDLDDEDMFSSTVVGIEDRLTENTSVRNPVHASENLNRLEDAALGRFLEKLARLREICGKALACDDEGDAALIWDEAFEHLFPLPEDDVSIEFESSMGKALSVVPIVDIDVKDARGNRQTYRDAVPNVDKGASLRFRIVNPEVIPSWATVDWVVRNTGDEAAAINDIGHSKRGTRALECDETTRYTGRHFMDCIVRASGRAIAVRRVPVYIRPNDLRKAIPRKPWYRRFVKRR
jgi:Cyclic GMP-AMP synthase DncV-like, nucleotidyltransferase domain/Adenylyl/Guanylyl and SMODS C-terminal sensor domain